MLYKDKSGNYYTVMKTPGKRPRYGVAMQSPINGGWNFLHWRKNFETQAEADTDLEALAAEYDMAPCVRGKREGGTHAT